MRKGFLNRIVKPGKNGHQFQSERNANQAIEIGNISTVRMGETHVCKHLDNASATRADIATKGLTTRTATRHGDC